MTEQHENLVIVAGHAVYTAPDFAQPESDAAWCLQDFQRGEPPFYLEHIRRGVELAAEQCALLVFSGGQTRRAAGPRSEAQSYWLLAEHFAWWGHAINATTEEFARDSLENVLFSVCRFRELKGHYPRKITVVSWVFKAERFALHSAALRLKPEFAGVNNPDDLASAQAGEQLHALAPFRRDPYGARPPLSRKRAQRNPFQRHPPYVLTCPEVAGLLQHPGPEIYSGPLPWD